MNYLIIKIMEKYIIKQEDLIGEIKDFPIEVVQKMVDYQVEQGNKADVTVFQKDIMSTYNRKGIEWWNTPEEDSFWYKVINNKDFDLFFEKYPFIPQKGEKVLISNNKKDWGEAIFITYIEKTFYPYITVSFTWEDYYKQGQPVHVLAWAYCKPLEKKIKYVAQQEVAEKFGVDEVKIINNK